MNISPATLQLILSGLATIFIGLISVRINKYIAKREKTEQKKEAKLKLHYINLDALIDSLDTTFAEKFGPGSRDEFKKLYYKKRQELMKEEQEINALLEHM